MRPSDIDPETGLRYLEISNASYNMARFLLWAQADSRISPEKLDEIQGSFVYACDFKSVKADTPIENIMEADLREVGVSEPVAKDLTEKLTAKEVLDRAARSDFIHEHQVAFGLMKTRKVQMVDERKFIRKINQLARS